MAGPNDFLDNEIEAEISPAAPMVQEGEQFIDFMSRTKDATRPDFTSDTTGMETLHLNGMHDIKKQVGLASANAGGATRGNPQAIFDNVARVQGFNSENQTADMRDIIMEQVRKDPDALAEFQRQEASAATADQMQQTPEMLQVRNRLTPEGQVQFDQLTDQERLQEAFPQLFPQPELETLAGQEPLGAPQEAQAHAAQATPQPVVAEAEAEAEEVGRTTVGVENEVLRAENMHRASMRSREIGNRIYEAARNKTDTAREERIASGRATAKDYREAGMLEIGTATAIGGGKEEAERLNQQTRGDVMRLKMEAIKTGAGNVEPESKANMSPRDKRIEAGTATAKDYREAGMMDIGTGNTIDRGAKQAQQINNITRDENRRIRKEQAEAKKDGFESEVHTLSNGQKVIAFRKGKDKGWQFRNFESDDEPGIVAGAGGWYQTLSNGKTKYFDSNDGSMGSDGKFYRRQLKQGGNADEPTDWVDPTLPQGVTVVVAEPAAAQAQPAPAPTQAQPVVQNAEALNWARANPNDPRSAQILAKLGVQ